MLIVEKIEGRSAVIENGSEHFEVPLSDFDGLVREGDVIVKKPDGRYAADIPATNKRRSEMAKKQNKLWE